jgi:phosphoglycerol transferase MdoB-like AlkP superfamily enzyme
VNPVISAEQETPPSAIAEPAAPVDNARRWIAATRLTLVWLFPAALGIYLKWYMLADQNGFLREARSMGLRSLGIFDRLSFFRSDLILGGILVPVALLVSNRFLPRRVGVLLTGLLSGGLIALIAVQIFALREVGRFSSLRMMLVGLAWGWHEPGSGIQYLISRQTAFAALSLFGAAVVMVGAIRYRPRPSTKRSRAGWKAAGELYLFAVTVLVLLSYKSQIIAGPYHENSFVRSATSLWKENAVETGEFGGLDLRAENSLTLPDFAGASTADLITRYQQLAQFVPPPPDPRYFGKEKGANVLFFILETTPEKYLSVDGDLKQFPNIAALRDRAFVGTRHYTTFPITRAAVFSMFSSWYPLDDAQGAFDSPGWDRAADFLPRLESAGYKTAVFSPLKAAGMPDEALFRGVGFSEQFYPSEAIATYEGTSDWRQTRIAADLGTLRMLESQIDQWSQHGDRFAAAFFPQIGHSPYPDSDTGNSAKDLERRGRNILATEDGWLGEVVNLLRKDGQLDNTVIVVVGDHGLRAITENPDLRRGTIDETAFHVPLLVYAPRALDHSERIDWLTSHVDIVPTVLDLLGQQGGRQSEQGAAIWNRTLADRTTYFFAKPMFGADGYSAGGRQFFMWHYFSDSVYEKSTPEFDSTDIIPRESAAATEATTNILDMLALEKAWHHRFSPSSDGRR